MKRPLRRKPDAAALAVSPFLVPPLLALLLGGIPSQFARRECCYHGCRGVGARRIEDRQARAQVEAVGQ